MRYLDDEWARFFLFAIVTVFVFRFTDSYALKGLFGLFMLMSILSFLIRLPFRVASEIKGGEQDERLYELPQIPFKCDICGATFPQSKGDGGCPECYSPDISEVSIMVEKTHTGANGGQYVGEFKNDLFHGQGTMTVPDGGQYVGEWKDGVRHGQGTETYASGSQYVGEHKYNVKHGQGTMTFADGRQYVGEYKDNIRRGQGTMTYANGRQYVGEFKDDMPNGQGTETYADGRQYVGEFKNGKPKGSGAASALGRLWKFMP